MSGQPFIKPTTGFDRRAMGKYDVLCRLASGGMSEILLAHQKGLAGFRKIVVLKTILADIRGEEDFVRMFLDEARTTAAFNHPHVAQVYDLDVDKETLFLAMEFVPGCTLVEMARACRAAKEPIPIGFTLMAVRDSALALHYAHSFVDPRGKKQVVIHRDVAEKNIMVTFDGVTKLLDFGIAKSIGRASHTSVGMVKGTSGYMSPEQIRGEPLDPRSDIFSLGVVAHECLTGMRLFHGKSAEEGMLAALRDEVQAPSRLNPSVTPEVDAVVLKALSREREGRYGSALELARAIEKVAFDKIWRSEESAELVQRLFAERRTQTRELITQSQNINETTGELRIDRILEAVGAAQRAQAGSLLTSSQRALATPAAAAAQAGPLPIDLSARRAAVTRAQAEARPRPAPAEPAPLGPPNTVPGVPPMTQRPTVEDLKSVAREVGITTSPSINPVLPAATINLSPGPNFDDDDEGAKTIPAGDIKALFAKANMELPAGLLPRPSVAPAPRQSPRPELLRPETPPPPPARTTTGETISQASTGAGQTNDIDDGSDAADRTAVGLPFEPSQPAGNPFDEEPATRISELPGRHPGGERSGLPLPAYVGLGVLLALAVAAVLYLAGVLPPGKNAPVPGENARPPVVGAKPAARPAPAVAERPPESAPPPSEPLQRPAGPSPGETPAKVDAVVVDPMPEAAPEPRPAVVAPPSPAPPVASATAAAVTPKKAQPKRQGRPQAREEEPELILEAGTLTLVTDPPCEVLFDGKSLGVSPLTKVSLPGGPQVLKLLGPDGTKSLKVDIKPGGTVSKRVALSEL